MSQSRFEERSTKTLIRIVQLVGALATAIDSGKLTAIEHVALLELESVLDRLEGEPNPGRLM